MMAASARPPVRDPDDWFAPAEWEDVQTLEMPLRRNEPLRSAGSGRLPRDLLALPHYRGRVGRIAAAAAAAVIIFTLIGLAASGAFTTSKPRPQPRPAATSSPRTTATPQRARARIAAPARPLEPGARGAQVIRLQRALTALGYLNAVPDGAYGPKTTRALVAFQRHSGLSSDGILGPQTLRKLRQALPQR
jgi:hypothetical protein